MPTKQETFDIVVSALRIQGCKSRKGLRCAYRGNNGLKCAVGHLIPDEDYSAEFECLSPYHKSIRPVLKNLGHDIDLCAQLQAIHDISDNWEYKWQELARKHDLIYTAPECYSSIHSN